jgi:hypothetical protein
MDKTTVDQSSVPTQSANGHASSATIKEKISRRKEAALSFLSNLTFDLKNRTNSTHSTTSNNNTTSKQANPIQASSSQSDLLESDFLSSSKEKEKERLAKHKQIPNPSAALSQSIPPINTTGLDTPSASIGISESKRKMLQPLQSSHSLRDESAMAFLSNIPLQPTKEVEDVIAPAKPIPIPEESSVLQSQHSLQRSIPLHRSKTEVSVDALELGNSHGSRRFSLYHRPSQSVGGIESLQVVITVYA